jgi:hypothetical protein
VNPYDTTIQSCINICYKVAVVLKIVNMSKIRWLFCSFMHDKKGDLRFGFVRYNSMLYRTCVPIFRRNIVPPSSRLKNEIDDGIMKLEVP